MAFQSSNSLAIYNLVDGNCVKEFKNDRANVNKFYLIENHLVILCYDIERKFTLIDLNSNEELYFKTEGKVTCFTHMGSSLCVLGKSRQNCTAICIWEFSTASFKPIKETVRKEGMEIIELFKLTESIFACVLLDGIIELWNTDLELINTFQENLINVKSIKYLNKHRIMIQLECEAIIWNYKNGNIQDRIKEQSAIKLSFITTDRCFLVFLLDNTLRFYDLNELFYYCDCPMPAEILQNNTKFVFRVDEHLVYCNFFYFDTLDFNKDYVNEVMILSS